MAKDKIGRPTKYKPEFCEQLIKHFDIEPWEEREIPHYVKSNARDDEGNRLIAWVDIKRLPVRMPTLRGFAKKIGVGITTIYEWLKDSEPTYKKDFANAFTCAKDIRKDWLIDLGLSGSVAPLSFKFVAVNCTDMRDKTESEFTGAEGGPIKMQIVNFSGASKPK